jgi:hypothetical protein
VDLGYAREKAEVGRGAGGKLAQAVSFSFFYLLLSFLFFCFIFIYNLSSNLSYGFFYSNKMRHKKNNTGMRYTFLYLFIGFLANLILLIEYEKGKEQINFQWF